MRYDEDMRNELSRLHFRIDAKLEQIRDMVGSDLAVAGPGEAERLAKARLRTLEAPQRMSLQINAALAQAQLRGLLAEMNHHLDQIASELRQTGEYSRAAMAYGRGRGR